MVARSRGLESCTGEQGGSATGPSPVDRARNGSKHHLLVDATGIPLAWTVTGGNRNDVTQLVPLVERVPPVRGLVGRPRRRPERVTADRGYDHDKYRRELRLRRMEPEIARRRTSTALAWAATAGSSSAPSPGCTSSSGCSFVTTAAPRSTRRSSRSAAASSASGDSGAHCDSTSKTVVAPGYSDSGVETVGCVISRWSRSAGVRREGRTPSLRKRSVLICPPVATLRLMGAVGAQTG